MSDGREGSAPAEPVSRLTTALAGRYTIERELGAGGMATIYAAHDVRHDRPVALKVFRPELAAVLGAERFLLEIRVTARLRHPHILPLFDSGTAGGFLYYVLPYVAGESLRQRLARERRLPVDEAIRIAREAADALDYAHLQGVVHRDIKPENILLESGHAVVADFGIARAISAAGAERLTEAGLALGTADYMSPEQASGDPSLDGRSDIYSLGCVLYEMLAGEPPFAGGPVLALLAKRLIQPAPRVRARRDTVPESVDRAIAKALAREPGDRFATARQFAVALETAPATRAGARGRRAAWAVGALAVAAIAAFAVWRRSDSGDSAAGAAGRRLTQLTFREGAEGWPAWSPDGRQIAFVGDVGGYKKLFVKEMATGEERVLTRGAQDDIQPAWAPDGKTIAFVRASLPGGKLEPTDVFGWYDDGGDIWALDVASGRERLLVPDAFNPAYSPDGARLAFDADRAGPRRVWVTDSAGRNPQQVTTDSSEAVVHTSPRWSPVKGAVRIAFRRLQKTKSDIMTVDLASRRSAWVTDDNVLDLHPAWSGSGRAIYFTSLRGGGLNLWRVPVSPGGGPAGPPQPLTTGAGDDLEATVASDGKRLAFTVLGIDSDLWSLPVDPATGRPTGEPRSVVGTTRVESRGAWSPDGRTIAFSSDRLGDMNLWLHGVGDGADRQLTRGPGGDYQPNWSPDGRVIAFFSARSGNSDIWTVTVADGRPRRLTTAPAVHTNPFFSPDGRHIAFHSDLGGRSEVWVMNADGSGARRVTMLGAGGHFMRWSPDGRTITFRAETPAGAQIHRVTVETGVLERLPDVASGAHLSFSPDRSSVMDVRNHKELWVHPARGAAPYQVFESVGTDLRIDYPVWSPDGREVLFDRAVTRGGDIWLLEGVE